MPDYQGNAKKDRAAAEKPEKNIERVVVGEVIVQKPTLGQKFKGLFTRTDPKTVITYVAASVLLPAAKNMLYDGLKTTAAHMIFGEAAARRQQMTAGGGSRTVYNNPVSRAREGMARLAPPVTQVPRALSRQHVHENFILSSRDEAELVLERMNDIIEKYEVVTVADLNDLVGLPTTHVDNKWGWIYLADVQVRQIREGFLIDFPPAEAVQ